MAKNKKESIAMDYNRNLREMIIRSKVPPLTLDPRWHNLFPEEEKTPRIKECEERLNELIKNQGKLTTDMEDLKKLKKKLMDTVIQNMGEGNKISERIRQKKQDKSQKLILEVNDKLREAQDELDGRPGQIARANAELLIECIRIWYAKLDQNNQDIKEAAQWLEQIRRQIMEKTLIKQDREAQNTAIYSYMHSLLGPKIMEQLDAANRRENK